MRSLNQCVSGFLMILSRRLPRLAEVRGGSTHAGASLWRYGDLTRNG